MFNLDEYEKGYEQGVKDSAKVIEEKLLKSGYNPDNQTKIILELLNK